MSANQFTQVRSQVVALSIQLSTLLSTYSQFSNQTTATTATSDELQCQDEIESALEKFGNAIKELQRIVDTTSNISATKLQQLTRHRDEFNRHTLDYKRIKSAIEQERNRLNLMFSVRSDIEQHNTRNRNNNGNEEDEEGYMLQERSRADQANNIMDGLISQVLETRDEILRQRNILNTVGNRLERSLSTVPGINTLLSKIDSRHRKNAIVITIVSLICLIILWFSL